MIISDCGAWLPVVAQHIFKNAYLVSGDKDPEAETVCEFIVRLTDFWKVGRRTESRLKVARGLMPGGGQEDGRAVVSQLIQERADQAAACLAGSPGVAGTSLNRNRVQLPRAQGINNTRNNSEIVSGRD